MDAGAVAAPEIMGSGYVSQYTGQWYYSMSGGKGQGGELRIGPTRVGGIGGSCRRRICGYPPRAKVGIASLRTRWRVGSGGFLGWGA